jgi:hypothetical protein
MIYTKLAQEIIDRMISTLRITGDGQSAFQRALEDLTVGLDADRGLIYRLTRASVPMTNQFTRNVDSSSRIANAMLSSENVASVVMAFISEFPDLTTARAIIVDATTKSRNFASLRGLFKEFDSTLIVPFGTRDYWLGILIIQSVNKRKWSEQEIATVEKLVELMTVIFRQSFVIEKYKDALDHSNALLEIDRLFCESDSPSIACVKAVNTIATVLGFKNSRVLFLDRNREMLVDQAEENRVISLQDDQDPFVHAVKSGQRKVGSQIAQSYFGDGNAIIICLKDNQETLGVFGVWQLALDYCNFLYLGEQADELGASLSKALAKTQRG